MSVESFYLGSGNLIVRRFTFVNAVDTFKAGDLLPFATRNATKMELYIHDQTVSSENGKLVFEDGKVTIDLTDVTGLVHNRTYSVSMRVWDDKHPVNGQLFCHPNMPQGAFKVKAVKSEM